MKKQFGAELEKFDISTVHAVVDPAKGAVIPQFPIPAAGTAILFVFTAPSKVGEAVTVDVIQEEEEVIVGGNTFVLRAKKPE